MNQRVLIVEDEQDLVGPLAFSLERQGFVCEAVATGREAIEAVDRATPDVVVLDLMLPDVSGLEVCRRLRSRSETATLPILILTARTDEYDKIVGFESGADDYVTKPFSIREVGLRLRALLRRTEQRPVEQELRFGEITVDLLARQVAVGSEPCELSGVELDMLVCFLDHRGKALTRDEIREGTWGTEHRISPRAVDTNVKRLRQKLGAAGRFVETVRGVGYRWAARPEDAPS